jgi:hypothetical protein
MENELILQDCLKNIRANIDKIIDVDEGIGAIFNTGFNYSLNLLDAKLNEKEMSSADYIELVLKCTGINLEDLFIKYITDHNMNSDPEVNEDKVDSDIVDFIVNSNVSDDLNACDAEGMSEEEYRNFIAENLNELRKSL